ncbi:MAG: hypothetical protein EBS54_07180 [Betaproteobacteria bacterium]|nr:hypothetical protein [Betaproteobacteria bacterium]
MSTNVGTLTIEMAANVARLSRDMDSARRTVEKSFDDIENMVGRLKDTLGGVFAGLSVTAFVSKIVDVQRQFDVLNSSLVTVTGSSDAADRAFAWLKDFAATTPFQLSEVTQAFIKMKALGLDASRESLTSYGNTASAMGKSLNQMIEAVADAATGEFETRSRLPSKVFLQPSATTQLRSPSTCKTSATLILPVRWSAAQPRSMAQSATWLTLGTSFSGRSRQARRAA